MATSFEDPSAKSSKRVSYYYDEEVGTFAYNLVHPMKPHRIKMAHNLILNYGLDRKMDVLRPQRSSAHEMTKFHTDEYVDFLTRVTPELVDQMSGHGTRFLIGEDCPAFEGLFEFCSISAGGSTSEPSLPSHSPTLFGKLTQLLRTPPGAARRLTSGKADICVNWAGGLHHAKKREASGFCYINDIVLAILELLRFHARVLYIDIDIHHGDGVEEAFYTTDRVMTCSFHKFGDYFPGTGDLNDRGKGAGKGYAVNFPLKDGIDDESYKGIFEPTIQAIMDWYRPGAVILQCGADSLAEDKLGAFNLSMKGHAACVAFVKKFNIPMMVLGGGGYTIRNVARTWAYETGVVVGEDMSETLPFNDYMEYFGPEFKLAVPNNNMDNSNSPEYLQKTTAAVLEGLRNMPFAPSAQMQHVPYDAEDDEGDSDSDLDIRISERVRQTRRHDEPYPSDDENPDSLERRKPMSTSPPLLSSSPEPPSYQYETPPSSSSEEPPALDPPLIAVDPTGIIGPTTTVERPYGDIAKMYEVVGLSVLQYKAYILAMDSQVTTPPELHNLKDALLSPEVLKKLAIAYDLPELLGLSPKQHDKRHLFHQLFKTYVGMLHMQTGADVAMDWVDKVYKQQLEVIAEGRRARIESEKAKVKEKKAIETTTTKAMEHERPFFGPVPPPGHPLSFGPSPPQSVYSEASSSDINFSPTVHMEEKIPWVSLVEEWRVRNKKPGNIFKDLGESGIDEITRQPVFTMVLEINGEQLRATGRSKKSAKEQ
ncbi:hypothetical protein RQP46_001937 [Phenoliferia psychrophenolica]